MKKIKSFIIAIIAICSSSAFASDPITQVTFLDTSTDGVKLAQVSIDTSKIRNQQPNKAIYCRFLEGGTAISTSVGSGCNKLFLVGKKPFNEKVVAYYIVTDRNGAGQELIDYFKVNIQ